MSVILYFTENFMPRFCPQIIHVIKGFIKTFYRNPFNHNSFEHKGGFKHTTQIHLQ